MTRKVIESAKIVLKTESGNRLEINGKGSAPRVMLTAFECLPSNRRLWLLDKMQTKHVELVEQALARASAGQPTAAAISTCRAGKDGDCQHAQCPQLRDGEPHATGRHCPLDTGKDGDA